jgi:hypothetical protein
MHPLGDLVDGEGRIVLQQVENVLVFEIHGQ